MYWQKIYMPCTVLAVQEHVYYHTRAYVYYHTRAYVYYHTRAYVYYHTRAHVYYHTRAYVYIIIRRRLAGSSDFNRLQCIWPGIYMLQVPEGF